MIRTAASICASNLRMATLHSSASVAAILENSCSAGESRIRCSSSISYQREESKDTNQ